MLPRISRNTWLPDIWDDFFGRNLSNFDSGYESTVPAVNISEGEDHYKIEFAAPGLSKKDFKIDLQNNVLTVSSESKHEDKEKKKNFMRREFSYSTFSRSFTLPESVDADKIKAKHDNGILNIHIPKKPEAVEKGPRKIDIS